MTHESESVEYLVKRFDMDHLAAIPDDKSPTCSFFGCWAGKERKDSFNLKRVSRRIGVERHVPVTQSQPHLVEPMKLRVYDQIPMSPILAQQPSQMSRLVSQGRRTVSRASTRTSVVGRNRVISKLSISRPKPTVPPSGITLRRNPSFRPIQLSIYVDEKRLSDLPEFDSLSFTEEGDIKPPPRAVIRTQSMDLLRSRSFHQNETFNEKPASMFEQSLSRRMSHVRNNTDSTVLSISRPPSEYDALNSHPVSWYSIPGIPPQLQFAAAPGLSKKILSPMKEEFTPPPSGAVIINGTILAFPDIDASRVTSENAHRSLLPPAPGQEEYPAAPSPVIDPGPTRRTTIITQHKSKVSEAASIMLASSANSTRTRATTLDVSQNSSEPMPSLELQDGERRSYFHVDYKTNTRINQWLDTDKVEKTRSRDSSVSTVKTTSTTASFAEHRRKRSHFYQLNQPKDVETDSDAPAKCKVSTPPAPLTLCKKFDSRKAVAASTAADQPASRIQANTASFHTHSRTKSSISLEGIMVTHNHTRTMTDSTIASTVATDVLFEQPETPELDRESRDEFHSATMLSNSHSQYDQTFISTHRRDVDAESMTTVDMKSRTGTMRSTVTAASSSSAGNSRETPEPHIEREKNYTGAGFINITKAGPFDFARRMTPSPAALSVRSEQSRSSSSPRTPLSAKEADVEKMVFEMCKSSGYRRVNVGVAF